MNAKQVHIIVKKILVKRPGQPWLAAGYFTFDQ